MIGITQDVTELRRIEQELREHQIFIRKITDAAPTIIASYNAHTGKFAFLNQGIEKLLGYPVEECFAQGVGFLHSIIHPDDKEETLEKRAQALAKAHTDKNPNAVAEFTYRMRHRNGQYHWFHTYATVFDRNAEGAVENLLTITIDVSEQKEASEKIKEQEYFIQQIADASPTILYLFDVDTQSIVYMNREVFFVLGYVPEEILEAESRITDTLYHPDDMHLLPGRKQSQKNFQQVDSMIQYECRMKSRDDEWRWFLVREIVFKTGERGEVKQILGAALDINRRKEMERTILQNTLQLEQSNSSLEEFAYVASHDLKEPLRKISTFGDRLANAQGEQLSAEGKIYLNKIIDASQRMQTMINDLLSISMISGNRSFERYSLQKILDETLLTLEFKIEQKNAIIKSTPLPEANVIVSQFRQLFQNLLSNSLKFTRPDVQPVIQIEHSFVKPEDAIHYQLNSASQYLKIVFTDNGIGFENEFAGKIFTIFHRLHGRSEYEGSGIGLAICKKIVAHHGGIIYAEGKPDVGASFTIILPA
jgi:PAS domain S-box-containing protein